MTDRTAPDKGMKARAWDVARWTWRHRRKVAAVGLVAVPFVARLVPGFPADDVLALLRLVLGAQ